LLLVAKLVIYFCQYVQQQQQQASSNLFNLEECTLRCAKSVRRNLSKKQQQQTAAFQ